jgi:AcrR family transcriptional regulator
MEAPAESSPLTPKLRRDAQRTHDRIVAAARELFPQRGLDISLDDIARHAGVGVATAYRHFPQKEQLIDAVFADAMARTVELAVVAGEHDSAWDGLVFWMMSIAEMQASDLGLRALMKSRSRGGERAQQAHEQLARALSDLLARAREQGDLRGDIEISDVGIFNYMLGAAIDLTDRVEPDAWRRYLGIVLDGMRSARGAPSELEAPALTLEQIKRAMSG